MKKKNIIKVLIVDDSAFIRVLLAGILEKEESIQVVATAEDPYEAREKIKKYNPDVLTLDIEMPKMDGLTFLKNIMKLRPMPVIMVSTLTEAGADVTLQALKIGAVDFVPKPQMDVKNNLKNLADELIEKVMAAAICNTNALEHHEEKTKTILTTKGTSSFDLIAVGASTGGTEAILSVVSCLPLEMPPVVLTQHIPDIFSTSYAKRLNEESLLKVIEVREAQALKKGHAYLAPGNQHMKVEQLNGALWATLNDGAPVNRHKPAVDVLFNSIAALNKVNCIAVLLTGMGRDGADGMLNLYKKGAMTIAQDESSSVVWGMPGAAVELSAAKEVLPLNKIPGYLVGRL